MFAADRATAGPPAATARSTTPVRSVVAGRTNPRAYAQ